MKKFAILTSVLALAACGGGSHHAGERVRVTEEPTYQQQYLLTTEQTRASNASVTSMVSEIAVCQNCASPRTTDARLSTKSQGDYEFKVYDLRDVKFVMADEGFGGEMQFDIDESNGEITKFNLLPDADDPEDEGMSFQRVGYYGKDDKRSRQFSGQVNHEGHQDAILTYNSIGEKVGLKYSDFGSFDIDVIDGWRPVFIGGYDEAKKIDTQDISNDLTFAGKVTGSVIAVLNGEGSGKALSLDSNANLTFDKNTQKTTMTASFNNWYDIKYTETAEDKNIALTNYKFNAVEHYKNYQEDGVNNNTFKMISNTESFSGDSLNSDVRYFGDNNTPIEAVGLIQVRDCGGSECTNRYNEQQEVRMNLSFGVTGAK